MEGEEILYNLRKRLPYYWNKYEIYTDNWQEIQKFEQKKLLTSKFVSPNSNCPLIFEFPAKYEQKIKNFIGHSEEKTSIPASSKHGMTLILT